MEQEISDRSARKSGIKKLLIGGSLFSVSILLFPIVFPKNQINGEIHSLIILCLPGGYALAGVIEIITNVPFSKFAKKWDSLRGWQRGVLGTTIAFGFFIILILATLSFMK